MWLPVPVDLKSFSFDRTYELLAPLLPGAVVASSVVLGHPDLLARTEAALGIGHSGGWALLLVGAYVSGFVLYNVGLLPTAIVAGILSAPVMIRRKASDPRANLAASKRLSWRKLAIKFLGAELFPEPSPNAENAKLVDEQWHDWYNALQDYLFSGEYEFPRLARATATTLGAIGWAMIAVRITTSLFHHWLFRLLAILAVGVSAIFMAVEMSYYWSKEQPTYWGFTARLLRELREKEKRDLSK